MPLLPGLSRITFQVDEARRFGGRGTPRATAASTLDLVVTQAKGRSETVTQRTSTTATHGEVQRGVRRWARCVALLVAGGLTTVGIVVVVSDVTAVDGPPVVVVPTEPVDTEPWGPPAAGLVGC